MKSGLMKIQYENTLKDLVTFSMYHLENSPSFRKTCISLQLVFPIALFLLLLPSFIKSSVTEGITLILPLILLWIYFVPKYLKWKVKKQSSKFYREVENKGLIGKHEIIITLNELIEKTEYCETKTIWEAVEKVISTKESLYIYISAVTAHVIPKNYFLDHSTCQIFFDTATSSAFVIIVNPHPEH